MSCSTDNCEEVQSPELGCININLIEGNHRDISLTFMKTIDDVTTEMDLSGYDSIHMDISGDKSGNDGIILQKSLGDGMELTATNVLLITFGEETFNLDCTTLYYDILFQEGTDLHHLIKGRIFIKSSITVKKDV